MSKKPIRLLLSMLLCMWGAYAIGQGNKTITGSVKDSVGNAIPGVSINVKGTNISGAADNLGNFRIGIPKENAVLVFSALGFESLELPVGENNNLSVILSGKLNELNEVVVTGFGVRKDTRKLAYSIQEVKGEDVARAGSVNIANSLQGKVAGVMISQGAGGPSSSSRIRIRGNTSISTNNTMPLFVIDGVLIQPGVSGADSWGDSRDFGNQLKNLNPDDYESLTVLKGSAASALYGSQAQNGVILITTKKGKNRNGLGVNVNQSFSWEKVYKLPDFQNEYGGGIDPWFIKGADGKDEVDPDNGPYYSFGPKFDGRIVKDADGRMVPWKANNLMDLFTTGMINNTNVAVEGGSEKTTFRFSYTNTGNKSIMPRNSFNRDNFSLRATQKIGQFINIDASVNYATSVSKNPILQGGNSNPLFRLAYSNSRNYPIEYALNNYIDTVKGGRVKQSPYLRSSMTSVFWNYYQVDVSHKEDNLLANLDINANITPWLSLLIKGNINSIATNEERKERGDGPGFSSLDFGAYSLYQSASKTARMQALLSGNKKLNEDFDLSVSVGGETQRALGGKQSNARTDGGFKVPEIYALSNSKKPIAIDPNNFGVFPQSRLDAVYAYGDITWKNMLTLNASARNDWNSTLTYPNGIGNYSYFYPSVGLSWVFSQVLKDNSAFDFLSFGKLRASLGYTGAGTGIYATTNGNYSLLGNYTNVDGALLPQYGWADYGLGNQDLKPEQSREYEVGADLRFFQGRVRLDMAFYQKNTLNQIINLGAPAESGISSRQINAGNVQNKGVEILLSATPVRSKDFEWTTTFNFSRNKNKVIKLYPGVQSKELDLAFGNDVRSVAIEGEEFGTITTGYAFAIDPQTGKKLLKQDGIFWRSGDFGQGVKNLGSMMEKFLLSNVNEVSYKGFNLFVQLDSKIGGKMASATHQYGSNYGSFKSTLFGRDKEHGGVEFIDEQGNKRFDGIIPDGVFAPGTIKNGADISGLTYAQAVEKGLALPMKAVDYYEGLTSWGTGIREYSVFENSWVALREVSVGYSLPKNLTSKLKMNTLRVNLVGRNLFYLYNTAKDHINPESVFSSRAGAFAEYGGLPYTRTIGFSLNAGF